jgi:hypothetical protein
VAGGSPWRLLDGDGQSAGGDRRRGDGRRSLAARYWGGKAFGARAMLGVAQVWPEEDHCGLTSRRLSAAAARLRWHVVGVSASTTWWSA